MTLKRIYLNQKTQLRRMTLKRIYLNLKTQLIRMPLKRIYPNQKTQLKRMTLKRIYPNQKNATKKNISKSKNATKKNDTELKNKTINKTKKLNKIAKKYKIYEKFKLELMNISKKHNNETKNYTKASQKHINDEINQLVKKYNLSMIFNMTHNITNKTALNYTLHSILKKFSNNTKNLKNKNKTIKLNKTSKIKVSILPKHIKIMNVTNITTPKGNYTKIYFCRPKNKTELAKEKEEKVSLIDINPNKQRKSTDFDLNSYKNKDGFDKLEKFENNNDNEDDNTQLIQLKLDDAGKKKRSSFLKN